MFFSKTKAEPLYLARSDDSHNLSSYSPHPFYLDDTDWPTVEHYYQAMKFEDRAQQEAIRRTLSPTEAKELADKHSKAIRSDWKRRRETVMTRGIYIKCRTHPEVAAALLKSGDNQITETSMYDYYWGCGRDGRGDNTYGKVLMAVRDKLKIELAEKS
jgi:ribA/ribD-fused uncharacterized protein